MIVGLIVPPADGAVPPEPLALYPDVTFVARGLGLPRLTKDGYDAVIDRVAQLAAELKDEGARAVSLMGTSLSFYRGPAGNAEVLEAMRRATGLPVTTMTDAVLEACAALGAQRLAVGTAYAPPVNRMLRDYLRASGLDVLGLEALNLTEIDDIQSVGTDELINLGRQASSQAPGADALFISCGGLRTLPVIAPLEAVLGIPVISSATAGAWGAVRCAGHHGQTSAPGGMLTKKPA